MVIPQRPKIVKRLLPPINHMHIQLKMVMPHLFIPTHLKYINPVKRSRELTYFSMKSMNQYLILKSCFHF